MAAAEVQYLVENHVATITINRPDKRNALSWEVIGLIRDRLSDAKADEAVRVVVLTGAGDRAFCAGADLDTMTGDSGVLALHEQRGRLASLFRDLWELGKPTVARVFGYTLAGGLGLALACDFVIAADDAQFGAPEVDVGLWPHMITVPLLRSMPPKKALELMLTGRRVDASEAARIGFVNDVVPYDELDDAVTQLTGALARKPPGVVRLGRDAFYSVIDLPANEALRQLHPLLTVTALSEEAAEGMAAFRERRAPNWSE